MDEKFRKKIIKDLEKSGFGSEMRAIREFLSRKWNCTGKFSYFDKDAQISKEGDLHAFVRHVGTHGGEPFEGRHQRPSLLSHSSIDI